MRAFRPSSFGEHDECEDHAEIERLSNIQVYAQRAEAGLPLFDVVAVRPEARLADRQYAQRD